MKTLAISNESKIGLPKMGIMTHLVELTRYDYIYIKDSLKEDDILDIKFDKNRSWDKNSISIFYKGYKLGYLNNSMSVIVKKLINRCYELKVIIKNKPSSSNPFDSMDVLIQIN